MPHRSEPWPAGTPCWVDLATPDPDAAEHFYGALLGWQFDEANPDYGGYRMCRLAGRMAAGLGGLQSPEQPAAWTTYIATDDADKTAAAIGEYGGTVLMPPMEIPEQGRMLIAMDPQGAAFGAWQSTGHPGVEIFNEPGAVIWNDANVPDPEAAERFYGGVFGWSFTRFDEAPGYRTIGSGGDPFGGIGALQGEAPPHWASYFAVQDADAAVSTATDLGATVVSPPTDVPWGRQAVLADPQGATFIVLAPAEMTPDADAG